jgi:co-chaperonin GroES (HSP10)
MATMKMVHTVDPAQEIVEGVGDLSGHRLLFSSLLIGIYQRPEKTAGGVILTDRFRGEDEYQGKTGLVLKKGPRAFVDDGDVKFHGENVNVGEWVWYRPSDGFAVTINGQKCRCIQDVHIKGVAPAPDTVW